jgi:hypothetical protein
MRLARSVVLVTCEVLLVMALFLAPMSAFADTLSWSIPPGVGTYSWTGGNAPLTGNGIGVQSVQDTTSGAFFTIFNGVLNFTTGPGSGGWSWGAGTPGVDELNLTGCIDNVTVTGLCSAQGSPASPLFTDDFTSATIFPVGPNFDVSLGNIAGTLNANLAQILRLSTAIPTGVYNTTLQIGGIYGSSFSNALNLGGSINSDPPALPEPGTLTLLGMGLLALVGLPRRMLISRRRAC